MGDAEGKLMRRTYVGGTVQQWVGKQGKDLYNGTGRLGPSKSRIMLCECLGMFYRVNCAGRGRC